MSTCSSIDLSSLVAVFVTCMFPHHSSQIPFNCATSEQLITPRFVQFFSLTLVFYLCSLPYLLFLSSWPSSLYEMHALTTDGYIHASTRVSVPPLSWSCARTRSLAIVTRPNERALVVLVHKLAGFPELPRVARVHASEHERADLVGARAVGRAQPDFEAVVVARLLLVALVLM